MSPNGHSDPESAIVVRSLGLRLPSGHRVASHRHDWHQLVYASDGVMTVETPSGVWVVPPNRAVWIPAGFEHGIRMTGVVRMRTVYLRPGSFERLPGSCCVVNVTPLLRELVLETLRIGMLRTDVPEQARFAAVLGDQLIHVRAAPLQLRLPVDARARAVAANAQADLSKPRPLAELVRGAAPASERSPGSSSRKRG